MAKKEKIVNKVIKEVLKDEIKESLPLTPEKKIKEFNKALKEIKTTSIELDIKKEKLIEEIKQVDIVKEIKESEVINNTIDELITKEIQEVTNKKLTFFDRIKLIFGK